MNLALEKQNAMSYDKSQKDPDPAQRRAAKEAMHDELKSLFEHMNPVDKHTYLWQTIPTSESPLPSCCMCVVCVWSVCVWGGGGKYVLHTTQSRKQSY